MQNVFTPSGNTVSLDITTTPQNISLNVNTGDNSCRIVNIGTQTVFINFLGTALTSTSVPILPGTAETFGLQGSATLSAVAPAAGSKLYVTSGSGS